MMYDEFVKGTGCRNNEHNRAVFEALEKIYMDRNDLSKEVIYQVGKLLVDNSLSPEKQKLVDDCHDEIFNLGERIGEIKSDLQYLTGSLHYYAKSTEDYYVTNARIKYNRALLKDTQRMLNDAKDRLNTLLA